MELWLFQEFMRQMVEKYPYGSGISTLEFWELCKKELNS